MIPKNPKPLTNSPSTGADEGAQGVQGPPNTPGKREQDHADRMTKSGRQRLPARTQGGDTT